MPEQNPYPIYGTVTLTRAGSSSNLEGATVWIKDRTEGTVRVSYGGDSKEDFYITRTNSSGQFVLDLAELTSSYDNGDKVRVYCEFGNTITFTDFTLDIVDGLKEVNFSLTAKSGLIDGLTSTVDKGDRKAGLEHLGTGLRPALNDGLT